MTWLDGADTPDPHNDLCCCNDVSLLLTGPCSPDMFVAFLRQQKVTDTEAKCLRVAISLPPKSELKSGFVFLTQLTGCTRLLHDHHLRRLPNSFIDLN